MADVGAPIALAETARRRWLRRLAPWLISGAVVTVILIRYPLHRIVDEMQRGDVLAMVPVAAATMVAMWFTAVAGDFLLLRRFAPGLGYFRLMRSKAGLSVLNALGMALNYGGFVLWIQRCLGCRPLTALGLVLMITVADLTAVSIIATGALALGDAVPADVAARLRVLAPVVGVVVAALLLGPRARAGTRPLLEPWRQVPRATRALSVVARCSTITVLITATWAAARAFGLPVPLWAWASLLPLLLVIGALPINVAGMGPVQAAWITLFSPWASGPQILAFQFLWHLMLACALFLRGAPFLRRVVAEIAGAGPAAQAVAGGQPTVAAPSTR